jgi:TolB-like protein
MKRNSLLNTYCILFWILNFSLILPPSVSQAQNRENQPRIAVIAIDTKGLPTVDPTQMGNIVRTELDRLEKFEVIDRYDIEYLLKNAGISTENCFGKQCLVDVGKKIKADKMMTGTVEAYGEQIVITLKLIDVGSSTVEKTQVLEFLNLKGQLTSMVGMTMKKMFDQAIDPDALTKLTKKFDYESTVNNPGNDRLNLSGPRMGFTFFTGQTSSILRGPKKDGGFNAYPLMFQFGYQFEVQYLNQGNFQALFEFIPIVTGLDQGKFLPSISVLNGMRSNISGWEFAFGPVFYMNPKAKGYIDNDNKWQYGEVPKGSNFETELRFDSRGEPAFDAGFVFAVGKSFKSGKLNIPVNAFFIPHRDGPRFGLSMGFNAKK